MNIENLKRTSRKLRQLTRLIAHSDYFYHKATGEIKRIVNYHPESKTFMTIRDDIHELISYSVVDLNHDIFIIKRHHA